MNTNTDFAHALSLELKLNQKGVEAVLNLLSEGNTVPFISRYRKEATGALDEVQIRQISERNSYLVDLNNRRKTILDSIEEQGKLTTQLKNQIMAADTKSALEDLYLPFRPKRRTRATKAREKGLEPLADIIWKMEPHGDPQKDAVRFVDHDKGIEDVNEALAGARDVVAERISENAIIRKLARREFSQNGILTVTVVEKMRDKPTKYSQYYDFTEPIASIPSHRYLAIRRGELEGVLRIKVQVDDQRILREMERVLGLKSASPYAPEFRKALEDSFNRLISPSVENDIRVELKLRSDRAAVDVFAQNLRNLLMAPPLGPKPVIGVDPGLRTGSKVAALDETGKVMQVTTLYLSRSEAERQKAAKEITKLIEDHQPKALAVGNGTGGRETESFLRKVLDEPARGEPESRPVVVQVSEAGASVYSASTMAREELADLDVTLRGAVSIARRLQDPLAELVKIDPKAIGVGQYQHDVYQPLLSEKLDEVVEDCVNMVGVELNTASAPLLSRVAGVGPKLAQRIIKYRDEAGSFKSRKELLKVQGLGPKTFEQAAGFLRIRSGENSLDASAVHPERYDLVKKMADDLSVSLEQLVGHADVVSQIDIEKYLSDDVGELTLRDILSELARPGRDPRAKFDPVRFRDDVHTVEDLKLGMTIEGVVTNVTNFGAFVDIGVHRDGLVHISELSDSYVNDPHKVVKVGDRVKVRVLEIDQVRNRISLSAKKETTEHHKGKRSPGPRAARNKIQKIKRTKPKPSSNKSVTSSGSLTHNPFADLYKKDKSRH